MEKPLRVLLAEDNSFDAELILRELRRAGFAPVVHRVDTEAAFVAGLGTSPEIVLSDYVMPQFAGPRALELLKEYGPDIPFILISGTIGEDIAVAAIRQGASDYLLKDRLARLGPAVNNALEEGRLRSVARQAEVDLHESALLTHAVLDSLTAHVAVLDAEEKILAVNAAWERLVRSQAKTPALPGGFVAVEYRGLCEAALFLASDSPVTAQILAGISAVTAREQAQFNLEYSSVAPAGLRWFSLRVSPLTGGRSGVVIVHEEVTERYRLEEQFRQAQKMETVGQLAGGVAHDFNNLLTVIEGYANLLQQQAIDPAEAGREISHAVVRASGLSRQLLTFSRKQVLQMYDLDLNAVVTEMMKMLARTLGGNIALNFVPAPGLPTIHADQGMMEQIILNLAVNARDAMPDGGRLTIATAVLLVDEAEALRTPGATPGPAVTLRVADTGSGMTPEVLQHIFEPFFTTKETHKGTGLGLANVQGIVKQHQGWIRLTSAVGVGTTFQIVFPANAAKIVPTRAPQLELAGGRAKDGETVLLVDDEPALRLVVAHALKHLGYRVLEASSGRQALAVFEEHHDQINLLLTDLVMPDGFTGRDLGERLCARGPQLRVLYSSGYSGDTTGRTMSIPEGFHFLQKPYSAESLARAVRACLDC